MKKALDLKAAEAALERGDYSAGLELLESIQRRNALGDREKAQIKMLIVTAHMGQGEEQKAID